MSIRNAVAGGLVAFVSVFQPVWADESSVGIVKNVAGDVKIMRGNTAIPATPGAELMRSDVLVSGPKATSGVVFRDGTLLTVGASSEVEISRYVFEPAQSKFDFALFLRKGEAVYSSGKIGKLAPEAVNINTPKSTVGIRGTRFIVKVD